MQSETNKPKKTHHFFKDVQDLGKQSKEIFKTTKSTTSNFFKLPWKQLPAIGWFYIILLILIIVIIGVFIAPYNTF